jgi:hypothetical protein
MKYLKVVVEFKVKSDEDEDPDQLQADIYEKVQSLLESETLSYRIEEDEEDDDEG